MPIRVTVDEQANAAYVKFRDAPISYTTDATDYVLLDYGEDGRLVGVEVLGPSEGFVRPAKLGVQR